MGHNKDVNSYVDLMRFFAQPTFLYFTVTLFFLLAATTLAQANTAPTIISTYLSATTGAQTDDYPSGSITDLVPGGTRSIHVNGIVEDLDGRADIAIVSVVFRRSGATNGNTCTADNNDCYRVTSCSLFNNEDVNQKEYDCLVQIQYYADSTVATTGRFPDENWVAEVYVEDLQVASATDNTVTKEMGEILALDIPTAIDFGTLNLAETTGVDTNVHQVISQFGNDQADVEVNGFGAMTCVLGTIPVANQQWALSDVAYDDPASTVLTAISTDTNLAVPYRDDDQTNASKVLYWNIEIPSIQISGSCSGTVTVSSIAS